MTSREEYIKNSITKWGPGTWDMMETNLDDSGLSDRNRWYMFKKTLWYMCGFCICKESTGSCEGCPLYPEQCMSDPIKCYESGNVISKIMKAWEASDKEAFHEHRRELVRKMASCLVEEGA